MSDQFQHPQPQSEHFTPPQDDYGSQIAEITQQVAAMKTDRVLFSEDLIGTVETVSSLPTDTPSSPYQQIKISGGQICFYDTVNSVWICAGAGYAGEVTAAGAAGALFPTGWTATHNGTGDYTVTHNLGTTLYSAQLTPYGGINVYLYAVTSNSFSYQTQVLAGGNTDAIVYFTVTL